MPQPLLVSRAATQIELDAALLFLESADPTLLLELNATVAAANLPAYALWPGLPAPLTHAALEGIGLIQRNILNVISWQADRIPKPKTVHDALADFWRKKFAILKMLTKTFSDTLYEPMFALIEQHAILKQIYEEVDENTEVPWSYPLLIKPHDPHQPLFSRNILPFPRKKEDTPKLLSFYVTVSILGPRGAQVGWIAQYAPQGQTKAYINRLSDKFNALRGTIPYILGNIPGEGVSFAELESLNVDLWVQYAQNDAAMSDELKQRHPILSFDEMARQYPNEWVAFVATAPAFRQRDAKGRVLIHAPNPDEFDSLLLALHEQLPTLPLSTDYLGDYEGDGSMIDPPRKP